MIPNWNPLGTGGDLKAKKMGNYYSQQKQKSCYFEEKLLRINGVPYTSEDR